MLPEIWYADGKGEAFADTQTLVARAQLLANHANQEGQTYATSSVPPARH